MALNRLGGKCVFASEIDKFASKAYETLYGGDVLHGDITKIDEKDIPNHDILTAGTPCQSFSVAGKRKGFDDTRGTLFFDVARVAKEKQPKVVWIENVKGLVNHDKGNTLDTMIQTLNDIGYVIDFEILNSKYFGVPQNRERIFIVAIREDLIEAEPWSEEATKGQTIVPKGKLRIGEWADVFNFDFPDQTEVTTRLRDILEPVVDEKYYLDEEKTAKLVAQLEAKKPDERMSRQAIETFNETEQPKEHGDMIQAYNRQHLKDGICPTLTTRPEGFKTASLPIVESEPQMLGHIDLKGNDSIKRTYSTDGISPTLTTMGGGHRESKIAEEQEWWGEYESDQDEWETERRIRSEEIRPVLTPDRLNKRQNGRRFKEDGEESFTLTAQDRHGVVEGVPPKYRIRKLTPLECWRLQGFPDEAHEAVKAAGISDSQRYKMAGNAVTVSVIDAIGRKLLPYL